MIGNGVFGVGGSTGTPKPCLHKWRAGILRGRLYCVNCTVSRDLIAEAIASGRFNIDKLVDKEIVG